MKNTTKRRSRPSLQKQRRRKPSSLSPSNIVGCRISHGWKEGEEPVTQWKGMIVDQLPTNPSVYHVKYDGVDCVYGLEIYFDKRILNLKVCPHKVVFPQVKEPYLDRAIVGRAVEHQFEGKHGSKENWRGVVLGQVPNMQTWFYITYENDPALYMFQLLDDYIEGNLRIISGTHQAKVKSYSDNDTFTGKFLEYTTRDGSKKIGRVIYQILAEPTTHFIMFDGDSVIYVYNLEEKSIKVKFTKCGKKDG